MDTESKQISNDLEEYGESLDYKNARVHTDSEGSSSKFDGASLNIEEISDTDSPHTSPNTVSNRGRHSEDLGINGSAFQYSGRNIKKLKDKFDIEASKNIAVIKDSLDKEIIDVKNEIMKNLDITKFDPEGCSLDPNTQLPSLKLLETHLGQHITPNTPITPITGTLDPNVNLDKVEPQDIVETEETLNPKRDDHSLEFLSKAKDKADLGLTIDNWMYNEIKNLHHNVSSLQEKTFALQTQLVDERNIRQYLEQLIGKIPTKLKEHETNLKRLVKESKHGMQGVTSTFLVVATSVGKISLDEFILRDTAHLQTGGPRRHTRQSTKKKDDLETAKIIQDSIEEVANLGTTITMAIKDLV